MLGNLGCRGSKEEEEWRKEGKKKGTGRETPAVIPGDPQLSS